MIPEDKTMRFLLGANTPQGFVSHLGQIINQDAGWRAYIIKGGPGSGKSTMMRKIAGHFKDDPGLELICCSSDIDSLDAVIVPSKRFCVLDGAHPHVLEPKHPGAVESLVDLISCLDEDTLSACRGEMSPSRS